MPRVRFTETRTKSDSEGKTYFAGQIYDLPQDQADRWVKRNVAVILPDEPKQARTKETKKPDDEDSGDEQAEAIVTQGAAPPVVKPTQQGQVKK